MVAPANGQQNIPSMSSSDYQTLTAAMEVLQKIFNMTTQLGGQINMNTASQNKFNIESQKSINYASDCLDKALKQKKLTEEEYQLAKKQVTAVRDHLSVSKQVVFAAADTTRQLKNQRSENEAELNALRQQLVYLKEQGADARDIEQVQAKINDRISDSIKISNQLNAVQEKVKQNTTGALNAIPKMNNAAANALQKRQNMQTAYEGWSSGNMDSTQFGQQILSNFGSVGEKISNKVGDKIGALGGTIGTVITVAKGISATVSAISNQLDSGVSKAIESQNAYMGKIESRMQGLSFNLNDQDNIYNAIATNIADKFNGSPYLSSQSLIEEVAALSDRGIAYNIEQRALLSELQDRLVTTFEVTNDSLLRLIRIQQADLTMTQMGAEAQLTQLFNAMFKDTSYLSDMYDTVSSAIIDASSQTSWQDTTGFNYAVQKWLGSMYSVGVSSDLINQIATGINYLGSGNVSGITGNTTLNNLFAMSASKAGLSYSDLLTSGLTDENTNKLLQAMVEYLQSISENTSNNVTKAAMGQVFNMSVSDLNSILNLTNEDIVAISNSVTDYQKAFNAAQTQLSLVETRTTIQQKVSNAYQNLLYEFGTSIVTDETAFYAWEGAKLANSLAGTLENNFGKVGSLVGSGLKVASSLTNLVTIFTRAKDLAEGVSNAIGQFSTGDFDQLWDNTTLTTRGTTAITELGLSASTGTSTSSLYNAILNSAKESVSGTVTTGTSSSAQALLSDVEEAVSQQSEYETYSSSTADANNTNLQTLSNSTSESAEAVISGEGGLTRDVSDLYAALFESKLAIHVIVDEFGSEMALPQLEQMLQSDNTNIVNELQAIRMQY